MCLSSAIDYDWLRQQEVEEHAVSACNWIPSTWPGHRFTSFLATPLDVRAKSDAQLEIRQVMQGIELEVHRWVPEIWTSSRIVSESFTRPLI